MYDFMQCEMPITWFFLRYNLGTGSIFAYRRGGDGGVRREFGEGVFNTEDEVPRF